MSGLLCAYCRGIAYRENGVDSTRIEHGNARFAYRCDCECHADQVVETAAFDMTLVVTVDMVEAFMAFAALRGITRESLADDDWYDEDDFLAWVSETIEVSADASGPGVLTYRDDVDEVDLDMSAAQTANLLRVVVPKLPQATRGSAPEAQIPGQMSIEIEEGS